MGCEGLDKGACLIPGQLGGEGVQGSGSALDAFLPGLYPGPQRGVDL